MLWKNIINIIIELINIVNNKNFIFRDMTAQGVLIRNLICLARFFFAMPRGINYNLSQK